MTIKKRTLYLIGIAVLSYSWRLLELDRTGFTWDELIYYKAGMLYLSGFRDYNIEHPPLIKYIIGISTFLLGRGELWVRLPVAILGSIIPIATFYLTEIIYRDMHTALLAAIIACQEVNLIGHSRLATLDAPATLFTILIISCYLQYIYNGKLRYLVFLALTLGLGLLTKYTVAVAALLITIYWILLDRVWRVKPHSILRLGLGLSFGLGIYVALSLLLGFNPILTITAIMEIRKESSILSTPLATIKEILVKLSPTYLALLAISLPNTRGDTSSYLIAVSFIILTLIVSILGVTGIRFLLTPLIFLSILAARGLIFLISKSRFLLALTVVILSFHVIYPSIVHPYYISHVNPLYILLGPQYLTDSDLGWGQLLKEAIGLITEHYDIGSSVITNYAPHLIEYYTGRRVYVVGCLSYGYSKINSIGEALKARATHLIVYKSDGIIWNYNEAIENLIRNSKLLLTVRKGAELVEVYSI